jgi:hypothetical protein
MERNNNTSTRAEMERYRKKSYNDGFFHVFLFYILPFIIFNAVIFILVTATPKISLTVADTDDYLTTQATLTIKSWFPTKSITADLDGEALDLGKAKNRTYTAVIAKNGLLEVNVTNLNGMSISQYEHVDILDDNPPSIENAYVEDGTVTLTFTDSQSGINAESIYGIDSNGNQVSPLWIDHDTNTCSFDMDPAGLVIHGQDRAGNEVQGTFTSHKEGDVETLDSEIESSSESEA